MAFSTEFSAAADSDAPWRTVQVYQAWWERPNALYDPDSEAVKKSITSSRKSALESKNHKLGPRRGSPFMRDMIEGLEREQAAFGRVNQEICNQKFRIEEAYRKKYNLSEKYVFPMYWFLDPFCDYYARAKRSEALQAPIQARRERLGLPAHRPPLPKSGLRSVQSVDEVQDEMAGGALFELLKGIYESNQKKIRDTEQEVGYLYIICLNWRKYCFDDVKRTNHALVWRKGNPFWTDNSSAYSGTR